MELWLLLGLLSYFSYSISTSIDKFMMNHKFGVYRTNTLKTFFDGVILLILALAIFELELSQSLILGSIILGALYAVTSILYFKSLRIKDVSQVMPYLQSAQILLIFIGSVLLFKESPNIYNYIGVFLIILGIYFVLSRKFKIPKFDKGLLILTVIVVIHVFYYLFIKEMVSGSDPLSVGIVQYFAGTIILAGYLGLFKKSQFFELFRIRKDLYKIGIAAVFGALGTFLLFTALSLGDASKVYPLAGLQSVFIFIIAGALLKEKFRLHRFIGTISVFIGIYLVSI